MEVIKKYSVYAFNPVMGSDIHLALEEVEFKGWVYNSFDTEEEAIQALVTGRNRFHKKNRPMEYTLPYTRRL